MNQTMKKFASALGLAAALTATSCIGPNNAYNSVASWNSRLTDSKWVNELVWLGGHIVPVYSFCMLGDLIVFNSVEFWTGKNLISKPEEFKPQN